MNFNKILIMQAAGIGDILFCQKIADQLGDRYKKPIVWPILKEIFWVKDYLYSHPNVEYVEYDEDTYGKYAAQKQPYIIEDMLVVPICSADQNDFKLPIMQCKFKMCNLDHSNWTQHIRIKRNKEREQALYDLVVKQPGYIYINKIFSTPPNQTESPFVTIGNTLSDFYVHHQMIEGYNLFDWLKVVENAIEIHTVSTGNFYIFEALRTKLPPIHIYNRDNIYNLTQLHFLKPDLNKHWIFHESYNHL